MQYIVPVLQQHDMSPENMCPDIFKISEDLPQDWAHFCLSGYTASQFEEFFSFFIQNKHLFAKIALSPSCLDLVLGNYLFKFKAANN